MVAENKFGKWGAWLAAGALAIGGHEIIENDEKNQTQANKVDKDTKDTDEENTDLPNKTPEEFDNNLRQIKEALNSIQKNRHTIKPNPDVENQSQNKEDEMAKEVKGVLKEIDRQLKQKLTPEELNYWREKVETLNTKGEWERRFYPKEIQEGQIRAEELAKNNPKFKTVKQWLEKRFPNVVIYTFEDDMFTVDQPIFYIKKDDSGEHVEVIWVAIELDFDENGYYFSHNGLPEFFLPWSASDEETVLELLEAQIKLNLLNKEFNDGDGEKFISLLKSLGMLNNKIIDENFKTNK